MFSRLGRRLRAFIKDFWDISFGPIFDFIADRFMDAVEAWGQAAPVSRMLRGVNGLIARVVLPLNRRAADELGEALSELNPIVALVTAPFLISSLMTQVMTQRLSAALKLMEQAENIENRPGLPPLELALTALNRAIIDLPAARDVLARYGIRDEWMDALQKATKAKVGISTIAEAVRRGLISYDDGALYAQSAGLDRLEFDLLFQMSRQLLTLAQLVRAAYLGVISPEDARARAGQIGVTPEDFDIALRAARQLLTPDQLLSAWLRGLMTDASLEANLAAHGYAPEDIAALKELAFFIPPPSDLIRMAVREVFTPEVAERFGQFQDFPEAFREWAAKQGISEFWARAYWAAHWDLPSITQGFEMFHRDVITREELELLLRAQDVMPFWRDRLLQISYNPVTRIDILRMYQLGVIDRDEVERRFRHLGYSPDDARVLAEYTIRLAAQREKDLSRTDIEELLSVGAITEDQAKAFLLRSGYTEEIANLILERIKLKLAQKEMADEIEVLKTRFLTGEISLQDVAAELQRLGAAGTMVDTIMAQLERERRKQRRSLTVGQVERAYKRGLLSPDETRQRLAALGYNDTDISVLLDLWAGEAAP
jgi:hypothetical protein